MKAALIFSPKSPDRDTGWISEWISRWLTSGIARPDTPPRRHDGDNPECNGQHHRPRVGLALSSGGAKGLARIGVLQVLEENNIPVDAVAGTSMGAYIGGLWASGIDGQGLAKLAATLEKKRDLFSLLDPVLWPRRGFVRGRKVKRRLRHSLHHKQFKDLDRPFYAVTTRLRDYNCEVIHDGEVISAILASIAIPGIVIPVHRHGEEFIDGGVSNPLPVDVLTEHAAVNITIAVNVLPTRSELVRKATDRTDTPLPCWRRPLNWLNRQFNFFARGNLLDVLRNAAMGSQMRVVEFSNGLADILIRPVDEDPRWHDYTSSERYIAIGRRAAQAALPAIREHLEAATANRRPEESPNRHCA